MNAEIATGQNNVRGATSLHLETVLQYVSTSQNSQPSQVKVEVCLQKQLVLRLFCRWEVTSVWQVRS